MTWSGSKLKRSRDPIQLRGEERFVADVANAIEDVLDGTASVDYLPVSPNRIHNILKGKDKSVDHLNESSP